MSLLTVLLTLGKELFPFLKEALLEGMSFRDWIKTNVSTAIWLAVMVLMSFLMIHMADTVANARRNEYVATSTLKQIEAPVRQMAKQAQALRDENAQLKADVVQLAQTSKQQAETIAQYQQWMGNCGVQFLDKGQCPVSKVAKASRRPATTKPQPYQPPIQLPPEEEKKRGLLQRIRDKLSGDKRKSSE